MSTTKHLSEKLREHAESFESHPDGAFYSRTAADARALEERNRHLETAVAGLEELAEDYIAQRNAATARVAELERTARENRNWREAHAEATARAEKAEKELDRYIDTSGALYQRTLARAEAAERKLEMHIAAHDMTSDQLEAAEAERKEFMLETQRKEIECNELASEVARLREMGKETMAHWTADLQDLESERDALRAKLAKARDMLDGDPGALHVVEFLDGEGGEKRLEGEIALGQEHYRARRGAEAEVARLREDSTWRRVEEAEGLYISMRDERDALRAKLEKVRAKVDKLLSWPVSSNPTAHKVAMAFQRILDGEGDT